MAKTRRVAARRFYDDALDAAERSQFVQALGVDGIDAEIAVLRVRLRRAIEEHPEDMELMLKGIETLSKAVATRFRLSKPARAALTEQMKQALSDLDEMWPQDVSHD